MAAAGALTPLAALLLARQLALQPLASRFKAARVRCRHDLAVAGGHLACIHVDAGGHRAVVRPLDSRHLVLPRHKEHEVLLHQLGMTLPQQPAPRISA